MEAMLGDVSCIAQHPGFEGVCINPWVLETAHMAYTQHYNTATQLATQHRRNRHIACRQFIRWVWGYLGRSIRVPLPSCVVHAIRTKFPCQDDEYVGFKFPILNFDDDDEIKVAL